MIDMILRTVKVEEPIYQELSKISRETKVSRGKALNEYIKKRAAEAAKDFYRIGYEYGMKVEHFTTPCCRCGKPINFSSKDLNWESKVKPKLYNTFSEWHHSRCP